MPILGPWLVCPDCGWSPGKGQFCKRCGRNLGSVEKLPTRAEWLAQDRARRGISFESMPVIQRSLEAAWVGPYPENAWAVSTKLGYIPVDPSTVFRCVAKVYIGRKQAIGFLAVTDDQVYVIPKKGNSTNVASYPRTEVEVVTIHEKRRKSTLTLRLRGRANEDFEFGGPDTAGRVVHALTDP